MKLISGIIVVLKLLPEVYSFIQSLIRLVKVEQELEEKRRKIELLKKATEHAIKTKDTSAIENLLSYNSNSPSN